MFQSFVKLLLQVLNAVPLYCLARLVQPSLINTIGTWTVGEWPASSPTYTDDTWIAMFGLGLLPLSDTAQLNSELSDLEWAAKAQADAVRALEPTLLAPATTPPVQESDGSDRAVEQLYSVLPANRGLHFLTLLSKSRSPFPKPRSAASANADTARRKCSAQVQSDAQPVDKTVKQRETNKRAQRRHRDRTRVRHT